MQRWLKSLSYAIPMYILFAFTHMPNSLKVTVNVGYACLCVHKSNNVTIIIGMISTPRHPFLGCSRVILLLSPSRRPHLGQIALSIGKHDSFPQAHLYIAVCVLSCMTCFSNSATFLSCSTDVVEYASLALNLCPHFRHVSSMSFIPMPPAAAATSILPVTIPPAMALPVLKPFLSTCI